MGSLSILLICRAIRYENQSALVILFPAQGQWPFPLPRLRNDPCNHQRSGEKKIRKTKAYFQSVNFIQHHFSSVEPSPLYVRWHNCDRSYFFTLNWRKKSKRKYLLAFVYYPVNEMIRINSLMLPLWPAYRILSVSTSELRQRWENKTLWDVLWASRLATHESSVRMSTFFTNEVLIGSIHVTWHVIQAGTVAY